MEERQKLRPSAILELNSGDSSNNTGRRMTNKFSGRKMNDVN